MSEGMEGVQRGIQFHLAEAIFEPFREFVIEDGSKFPLGVPCLDQWNVGTNVCFADHNSERVYGSDWAEDRTVVVTSEWDLLDSLRILDCLRLVECEKDTGDVSEIDLLDVTPAQEADGVHIVVGLGNERGGTEHREEGQECEDLVRDKGLV